MKFQRGVTISGLLIWCVIIAVVALLGMKVLPTVMEYYKTLKDAKATVSNLQPGATVADVRKAYANYANIDNLELKPEELEITKDGNQIVISFAYDKKIPLFLNVNLLIEYQGSTSAAGKD